MIRTCAVIESPGTDPHYNLALERYLLEQVPGEECILYLWQNQNTVVIGRNQNAWRECRTALLRRDGGTLARRLSGGGAVFHDLGNLNFTFLMPTAEYNERRQEEVILAACRSLGIDAEMTGRNDLTVQGRKFSGNAYYHNRGKSYHHGTLLVDADRDKMGRYLQPSRAKLRGKGVDSVRSRVINLKELLPSLTVDILKEAVAASFASVYGRPVRRLVPEDLDQDAVSALYELQKQWEWITAGICPSMFPVKNALHGGNCGWIFRLRKVW
ncbi:MAG: lipoate--protein ligase [Firmicutes bacterium]|nr:lipoate--protein ligase [Bacillota bacterium]